jgi:hypothetical protein
MESDLAIDAIADAAKPPASRTRPNDATMEDRFDEIQSHATFGDGAFGGRFVSQSALPFGVAFAAIVALGLHFRPPLLETPPSTDSPAEKVVERPLSLPRLVGWAAVGGILAVGLSKWAF